MNDFTPKQKLKHEETAYDVAYKLGERYLYVQSVDDGFDYTIYDKNLKPLDGGIYDDPDSSMSKAINNIIEDFVMLGTESIRDRTAPMLDTREFLEKVEVAEEQQSLSNQMDKSFEENMQNAYAIYQLKHTDHTRSFRFEGLAFIERNDIEIDSGNYNNLYTATVDDVAQGFDKSEILNMLFERFNINRPSDFRGHSISIGDVVALKMDGHITHHFVDTFGFKETAFLNMEESKIEHEIASRQETTLTDLLSEVAHNPKALIDALTKDYAMREKLSEIMSICEIAGDLSIEHSFEDMQTISSISRDIWLKYDDVALEDIRYFITSAINDGAVTADGLRDLSPKIIVDAFYNDNKNALCKTKDEKTISISDVANALQREKKQEKPSVLQALRDAKKQCVEQNYNKKKGKER